jgi:hypothetical protein
VETRRNSKSIVINNIKGANGTGDSKKESEDTFLSFFDKLNPEEALKFIQKNATTVDAAFVKELHRIKPFRKELYKDRLSDKLYVFNEVNKISHDPLLMRQFNQLLRKRKEMQRAMDILNKHN